MDRSFKSYIPHDKKVAEFTLKSLLLGIILGLLFAIANAYLALKIGTTISASIPAAIISMSILRIFFRKVTVLENNIVQTIATVGEGLAAGVVFTIPALFFLDAPPSIGRIFLLATLGGLLGILFMIPMRRYIIVEEHGELPFPEGTACSEILIAGERGKTTALVAIWGFLIAVIYKTCSNIFYIWQEGYSLTVTSLKKLTISMDATPALLGVGYIIGIRITSLMFAGGVLGWWIFIPLIREFGVAAIAIPPSKVSIAMMSSNQIWAEYIRYIGAGAVAIGGLISLVRIGPLLFKTVHVGFKELFSGLRHQSDQIRTDRDISLKWLILGCIAIILTLWLFPGFSMNLFTIVLLVLLGFFFVAVTSITVGLVGSSSNPVSGMTITTLLITCILFVSLGWTERAYLISAITMSCVANVAICMAGTTSQDLKTGFLLGSTPRWQQLGEIIGVILPSFALGGTIYILNAAYQIGSDAMPAPQATLMALIAKGVIQGDLPYTLVGIGVLIGLFMQLLKIPILPFAIGLYLPLSLSSATMLGGIISWWVNRKDPSEKTIQKGILTASGLIGGDACTGILIAIFTVSGIIPATKASLLSPIWTLIIFLLLALGLGLFIKTQKKENASH